MELGARAATLEDVETIIDLAHSFWNEQRAARGGAWWAAREAPQPPGDAASSGVHEALIARYRAIVATSATTSGDRQSDGDFHERSWLVVGTIDEVVLGYSRAVTEQLGDSTVIGRIHELFVTEQAREVSLGDEIINLVVAELQSAGCAGVDAYALPGERLTKNFFESHGFKARLLTMHHRFG